MKTALVFGHTSGLGFAVTKELLNKKFRVIGFARSKSDLKSDQLVNIKVDLSSKGGIETAVSTIKQKYSRFDAVIYCSGVLTAHDIDKLDYDQMEQLYKIIVFAPMFLESRLLPLIKKNSADVVNITSSALIEYYVQFAEYTSAKAAFQRFTKDLQKHLSNTKCRVIEFCPGAFASNIYKHMTGQKINRDESIQVSADEYARVLVYLLELPKIMEVPNIYVDRKWL